MPSTLPTRSTTAMTEGLPCACASLTAWAMILRTSSSLRNDEALAQKPLQPESGVCCGGGGDVPVLLIELLPPPHAASVSVVASTSQSSFVFRIAPSPQRESGSRTRRNDDASPAGAFAPASAFHPAAPDESASNIIAQPTKIETTPMVSAVLHQDAQGNPEDTLFLTSFPRKRESILLSTRQAKNRDGLTRRACGSPYGPFAARMFSGILPASA